MFLFGSKTYCGYCQKAKRLLTQLGADFEVLELDEMSKNPNPVNTFWMMLLSELEYLYACSNGSQL